MAIRTFVRIPLLAAVATLMGCGTIYSTQDYGSPQSQTVSAGATRASVFANMGQPDAHYKNDGTEVFIYRRTRGTNILGLYSKIRRDDIVVIYEEKEGEVVYAGEVPVGAGMTILSPPMLDATHPVHTDTLLFEAQNYMYEASED